MCGFKVANSRNTSGGKSSSRRRDEEERERENGLLSSSSSPQELNMLSGYRREVEMSAMVSALALVVAGEGSGDLASQSDVFLWGAGEKRGRQEEEEGGGGGGKVSESITRASSGAYGDTISFGDPSWFSKGNQSTLKYARQEYGIHKFPPRKLISQSHSNETLELVDHEGIAQLNSDTVPSDQALAANVDTNSDVVKEIPPPLFLPTARQDNLDEDAGNDEVEAVGMGSDGAGGGEMEEGPLDSRYLGKGKKKEITPKGEKRSKKTTGVRIDIPFEDILQTKRMLLKDAAKHLKVSRSTMKRVCRDYNIRRWPPREEHKPIGQSPTNKSPPVVDKEQIQNFNSDKLLRSNQVSASIDTNSVTVKARYGKVTIKFQLSWPWGIVELEQQVKKRLKLEAETFYINYKDEDNELILLACDEDLQDYISRSTLLGTSLIEVFLEPK